MQNITWRILMVDDDSDDQLIVRELLAEARQDKFLLEWVATLDKGLAALVSEEYDAVLVDYDVGGENGIGLIRQAIQAGIRTPMILLTGQGNYDVDLEAMQVGAADYLNKNDLNAAVLERSIRFAIERNRLLEENQSQRDLLQAVLQALPVGVAIVDARGGVIQTNQEYERVWGGQLPHTETVDDYGAYKAWWGETGVPLQPEEWASVQAVLMKEPVLGQFLKIERFDGSYAYIINSAAPIFNTHGEVVGSTVALLDVTERVGTETELRRLEAEQIENTAQMEVQRRLIQQREMERLDIARDLHDSVLQEMMAVGYALAEAIGIDEKDKRIERLQWVQQSLRKQAGEIRTFCSELRPPALAPFGLEKAIRSHIEAYQDRYPGLRVTLNLEADRQILPQDTRMALFRVYQEGVNNIARHAKASEIQITWTLGPGDACLEIEDNGVGFEVPHDWVTQARSGHLGLLGMRERVESIGGQIEFDSQPGAGTRVRVVVGLASTH